MNVHNKNDLMIKKNLRRSKEKERKNKDSNTSGGSNDYAIKVVHSKRMSYF
jgi:hypothetical protein